MAAGISTTVQLGESMASIAAQFGIIMAAVEPANLQISNPNMIEVGQVLNLPASSSPSPGMRTSGQGSSNLTAKAYGLTRAARYKSK